MAKKNPLGNELCKPIQELLVGVNYAKLPMDNEGLKYAGLFHIKCSHVETLSRLQKLCETIKFVCIF